MFSPKGLLNVSTLFLAGFTIMSDHKVAKNEQPVLTYARLNKPKSTAVQLARQSIVDSERTFTLFGSSLQTGIVSPDQLRLVYLMHPLANRGIEARVNAIFSRGFNVTHKDQAVVDETEKWMKKVNFYSTLRDWARNAYLFGQAHLEVVPSRDKKSIDELVVLPNDVDYIRDSQGRILFGADRKPKGFEQKPETVNAKQTSGGMTTEKSIVFSNPVARLTFTRLNGQYEGVSLLQPAFRLLVHDLNIQESVAIAISRHGYAQLDVSVGAPEAPPNQAAIDDVAGQLEELNSSNEFVHSYTTQVKVLESNSARSYDSYNQLFIKQIVSQLGVPEPILLGTGENSNRSTSDTQGRFYNLQAAADQMSISTPVESIIFSKLAEMHGWADPPSLEWNETFPEDETQKIGQVATMFEKTIISRDEARELLGFEPGDFGDFSPVDTPFKPPKIPGQETRGDPGMVPDPGKIPEKETTKPKADPNPKAKGRSAMMSLEKELSSELHLFDGFMKNSLSNAALEKKPIDFSSFSKDYGDRLYVGLKSAYKEGLADSFERTGLAKREALLTKEEAKYLSKYTDELTADRFAQLSEAFEKENEEAKKKELPEDEAALSSLSSILASDRKMFGRKLVHDSYDSFARTETWKAYNLGLLGGYKDAKVKKVSRQMEKDCANCKDCPKCNSVDYSSVGLSDAAPLLPQHPNCRCFWSPAE